MLIKRSFFLVSWMSQRYNFLKCVNVISCVWTGQSPQQQQQSQAQSSQEQSRSQSSQQLSQSQPPQQQSQQASNNSNNNNNSGIAPNNSINAGNNNNNSSTICNPAPGLIGGTTPTTKIQLEQLTTMREALFSQDGWGCQHVNQDTNWDVSLSFSLYFLTLIQFEPFKRHFWVSRN